jgi:hypothetical protein
VQTFAVHFNAISGSRWVDGLYEEDQPPKPRGVLAMAAAAVCGHSNDRFFTDTFIGRAYSYVMVYWRSYN